MKAIVATYLNKSIMNYNNMCLLFFGSVGGEENSSKTKNYNQNSCEEF